MVKRLRLTVDTGSLSSRSRFSHFFTNSDNKDLVPPWSGEAPSKGDFQPLLQTRQTDHARAWYLYACVVTFTFDLLHFARKGGGAEHSAARQSCALGSGFTRLRSGNMWELVQCTANSYLCSRFSPYCIHFSRMEKAKSLPIFKFSSMQSAVKTEKEGLVNLAILQPGRG